MVSWIFGEKYKKIIKYEKCLENLSIEWEFIGGNKKESECEIFNIVYEI